MNSPWIQSTRSDRAACGSATSRRPPASREWRPRGPSARRAAPARGATAAPDRRTAGARPWRRRAWADPQPGQERAGEPGPLPVEELVQRRVRADRDDQRGAAQASASSIATSSVVPEAESFWGAPRAARAGRRRRAAGAVGCARRPLGPPQRLVGDLRGPVPRRRRLRPARAARPRPRRAVARREQGLAPASTPISTVAARGCSGGSRRRSSR